MTPDPLTAIRDALTAAGLVDPDDPDLPATCTRLRDLVAAGADAEQVADHLDTCERLGTAGDDVIQAAARAVVAAAREEKQ